MNDLENVEFDMEVPESGSYAITVLVSGLDCFDCCSGDSCSGSKGRPVWRGMSPIFNTSASPGIIQINPDQTRCD